MNRTSVSVWEMYLDEFALLFGHLLTFLSSGVGHLAVFLVLCLTMLFTLGNAHLDNWIIEWDEDYVVSSQFWFPLPACEPCNIWASHDADIFCHKPRRRCHPHKSRTSDIPGNQWGHDLHINLVWCEADLDRIVTREKLWNLPALLGGYITAGFLGYCQTLVLLDLLADLLWNLGALVLVHQLTLLLRHLLTLLAVKGGSLVGGLAVHRLADLLVLGPANRLFLKMTNIWKLALWIFY